MAFSFGWTPCIGPILGTILALAAEQGSALVGAGLLLMYSLGLCIPFVVITLAANVVLHRLRSLHKYLPIVQRIGGTLNDFGYPYGEVDGDALDFYDPATFSCTMSFAADA